jgi:hypothetical protein
MTLAGFVQKDTTVLETHPCRSNALLDIIVLKGPRMKINSPVPLDLTPQNGGKGNSMNASDAQEECIVSYQVKHLPPPTARLGTTVVLGHLFLLLTTATLSM